MGVTSGGGGIYPLDASAATLESSPRTLTWSNSKSLFRRADSWVLNNDHAWTVNVKIVDGASQSSNSMALQVTSADCVADLKVKLAEIGAMDDNSDGACSMLRQVARTRNESMTDDGDARLLFRGIPLEAGVAIGAQGVCDGCELQLMLLSAKRKARPRLSDSLSRGCGGSNNHSHTSGQKPASLL